MAEGLVSIQDCVEDERAGNRSIRCLSCRSSLDIRQLLNQQPVESEKSREFRQWLELFLADQFRGVHGKIRAEGQLTRQHVDERIAALWDYVGMQGDAILDAFGSEWKHGPRLFSLLPIPGDARNPQDWVAMKFRVTVWCEASRRPVPVFRKPKRRKPDEYLGSEIVTLPREWVSRARRMLEWSRWAIFAVTTAGAGGVGALVSAAGGVISSTDARALAFELGEQMKAFKELGDALPDDGAHPTEEQPGRASVDWIGRFGLGDRQSFGTPVEGDKQLVRELREMFAAQDPTWGGLELRDDGQFGRIWAHPDAPGK